MIKIDPREKKKDFILNRLKQANYPVEISAKNLPIGDYIINDKIVIELKESHDYLSSYNINRLNNQLYDQSANYRHSFLVIYGNMSEALDDAQFPPYRYVHSLVKNALLFANDGVQGKISVIMLMTIFDVINFLQECYDQSKQFTPADILPIKYSKKLAVRRKAFYTLLPNVGKVRMNSLMEIFPSPADVCAASIEQIAEAKGFGVPLATKVYDYLHYRGEDSIRIS